MKDFLVVGDSFVEGVGDPQGGWVERFRSRFPASTSFDVDGVGGRNIKDVKAVVSKCLGHFSYRTAILCVGINDSRDRPSLGGMEVPPTEFQNYYKETILLLENSGARCIVCVGLSRMDESLVLDYKPDKSHTNDGAQSLDRIIADLCIEMGHIYVPISHIVSPNTGQKTLSDGLHPNALGHQSIADAVTVALSDNGFEIGLGE